MRQTKFMGFRNGSRFENKAMTQRTIVPGQIEGFLAACPFCTARQKGSPQIGVHFRIISGSCAGQTGVVLQEPDKYSLRSTEIVAHMDNDPERHNRRMLIDHELMQQLPIAPVPEWAPFLSLSDAAILDAAVCHFCSASSRASRWRVNWPAFLELIRLVWQHRLPITALELSDVLSAHGAPRSSRKRLSDCFDSGLALLVNAAGREPIKKKRTKNRLGQ